MGGAEGFVELFKVEGKNNNKLTVYGFIWLPLNAMFLVLLRRQKPYHLGLLLTHKNGDFGAVSEANPSCLVCFYELNAFSRKLLFYSHHWFQCYFKKVSLWNSPKRFNTILSSSRYTWWPLYDLISLRSLFLIKIFFIGGQFIPVFLS